MDKRLKNKKAIVTGGSRGIGEGIVKRLYNEGAEIIIADIREELAENLIKDLDHNQISFFQADLSQEEEIKKLMDYTKTKWGSLDFLINNAGIEDGYTLAEQTYESYRKTMKVNMDAPFLCSKYALSLLEKSKTPRIIMITSIQGVRGYKGNISYNTAKGGLINMTRVLAVELAEKNILVNSVAPGFINTPLSVMKDGNLEWDTDWFNDVYLKYEKLPMGRYGNPDDIAGAVYFFCSEDSKYVTGQTLLVDGGVSSTF
ncbi:MAG: SDR family oxidoreductase [Pelagibacteraceae bacterium]|jgi:3-oxoacyl-[acyl-carrier protein] reductase|nr:SDR family oxidoreductase [Pelagibacteraceae bacterium]MBT3902186.1 SDR family oxidoreductase [Pelagibacteraceae bacterium]MBT4646016.1 SDR family oxidoreductase [Pelagibacteraceae bacterium]MBT4951002.1 SDR family oxidoreductase [Pelagibacteraceae bacterium]MBT5215073.1 SDR family oxidoreductase [Pelagibacteraceae bacterium]